MHVPKKKKGEHFINLDMLTTLLAQRKKVDLRTVGKKPIIEILNNGM